MISKEVTYITLLTKHTNFCIRTAVVVLISSNQKLAAVPNNIKSWMVSQSLMGTPSQAWKPTKKGQPVYTGCPLMMNRWD